MVYSKILKSILILPVLVILNLYTKYYILNTTYAQTNKLTATIPDESPPTAPILISPENGSFVNTASPLFSFYKSTDANSTIWYYQLFLNDNLLISQLPAMVDHLSTGPGPEHGAGFTVWGQTDKIKFKLGQKLEPGSYTWKIRAWDTYRNYADSALWTFTIDQTAPQIIINQIAEHEDLNLSSLDPNSITSTTLFATSRLKPVIKGRSEPSAALKLILESKTESISLYTTADSQGFFSLKPDQALEPGTYTLYITASDAARNTTSLKPFQITIKKQPVFWAIYPFSRLGWLTAEPVCPRVDWRITSYILTAIVVCLLGHFLLWKLDKPSFPLPLYLAIGLSLTNLFLYSTWLNLFVTIGLVFLLIAEGERIFEQK